MYSCTTCTRLRLRTVEFEINSMREQQSIHAPQCPQKLATIVRPVYTDDISFQRHVQSTNNGTNIAGLPELQQHICMMARKAVLVRPRILRTTVREIVRSHTDT